MKHETLRFGPMVISSSIKKEAHKEIDGLKVKLCHHLLTHISFHPRIIIFYSVKQKTRIFRLPYNKGGL